MATRRPGSTGRTAAGSRTSTVRWLRQVLGLWRLRGTVYVLRRALRKLRGGFSYQQWIDAYDTLSSRDRRLIEARIGRLPRRPLLSIVIEATRDAAPERLQATIASLHDQLYGHWELFIAHASDAGVTAADDGRIRSIAAPPGATTIEAANLAIAASGGEFLAFVDPGDRLAPQALYIAAEEINARPEAALLYSDEDVIDRDGRRSDPWFKTDWSPDLFRSQDYLGGLRIYRATPVKQAGGLRGAFAGAHHYDLALRIVEAAAADAIRHLPFVLCHRHGERRAPDATALERARQALRDHLGRTGIAATVEPSRSGRHHRVRRELPAAPPAVSIVIPTRNRVELLKGAIDSILARTRYPNYEIVVVDNASDEPDARAYLSGLAAAPRIRVLRYDRPFNFSAIVNFGAAHCDSPLLVLLNNDVVVIDDGWLDELVSQALRPEVGAVGAMLYYPDDVIQHAGVLVGIGGAAVNCFTGLRRGAGGYFSRTELIQNYSAVTAACLACRREVFAEVGGFDAINLPVAFNDVDFGLRLRERGHLVTWTPYAELYHLESASRADDMAPDQIERFRREQSYLAERWAAVLPYDPYYNPNLSLYDIFGLFEPPRRRPPWRPSTGG